MSVAPFFPIGLSAAVHLGLLSASALILPPHEEPEYGLTQDQRQTLSRLLEAADADEIAQRETELAEDGEGDEGDEGKRTRCEEGTMSNARAAALRDAAEFGMTTARAGPGEWVSPWDQGEALADDGLSARCDFWGDSGATFTMKDRAHLPGVGDGDPDTRVADLGLVLGSPGHTARAAHRLGEGAAPFLGSGRYRRPRIRAGAVSVSGLLPPEVVQRVLRSRLGRVRLCYEHGLRNNPDLAGRVAVRFVIGRDGAVSNVRNAGSDIPDGGVLSCVVRAHYGLSFPQPESGVATVVFPIVLGPGG